MNEKWDKRLMALADFISEWSDDPKKGAGAVIARGKRIISLGYNGLPEGIAIPHHILYGPDKNLYMAHAERNACDFATVDLEGCTIYSSFYPCNVCANAIIQNRIARVVTRRPVEGKPQHNWDVTTSLFEIRGIQVDFVD